MIVILAASIIRAEEIVKKIKFSGDKPSLEIALFNRPGQVFQPDSLTSDSLRIISYYQERGWFDCLVSIDYKTKSDRVEINYNINRNDRYSISISLNDLNEQKEFYNELVSVIALYENKPAISSYIENLADDIIEIYANNGYPYCEVRIIDIDKINKPAQVKLTLNVNPGPKVIIEKFRFKGRINLDHRFLQTYTGLIPPMIFSSERFNLARKRMSTASFIKEAGDYQLRYSKSAEIGVIIFPLEETSPLLIDGALGYSSKNKNFFGQFRAEITNILGKGRRAVFDWSKKDRDSRSLKIIFSEPYPFGVPIRLDLEAYQDDRDSLYIESGGAAGLFYILSDIYIYGVSAGISRVTPESYGKSLMPVKQKKKLMLSFSADTRNYPANATRGDYLFMKGVFVRENTKQDDNFAASVKDYRTIELKIEKYLSLTMTSILYGGLFGQGDFSRDVPFDRQFALGGIGSLRGYSQGFFYVSRSAMATLEYRLLTAKDGRAYIFSDMAIFQTPETNEQSAGDRTTFKAGIGIGLAASVKGGLTTLEIAVPCDEGLSSAKLHFGLKAGF